MNLATAYFERVDRAERKPRMIDGMPSPDNIWRHTQPQTPGRLTSTLRYYYILPPPVSDSRVCG